MRWRRNRSPERTATPATGSVVFSVSDEVHRHPIGVSPLQALGSLIAREGAAQREEMARLMILGRLPRTGPWLVEHPKMLSLVFRLWPALRPRLVTLVDGSTAHAPAHEDADAK